MNTLLDVFSPFCKTPELGKSHATAVILLIGAKGTGKHKFAESLLSVKGGCSLSIRIHNELPLPESENGERPRIDWVVFLVDLKNKHSFQVVENALNFVGKDYLNGRCCFLVSGIENYGSHSVSVDCVETLAEKYELPLFFTNVGDENNSRLASKRILRFLKVTNGYHENFSFSLMQTSLYSLVPSTFLS
eukprot:Sdes_comp10144_c0_seq1m1757